MYSMWFSQRGGLCCFFSEQLFLRSWRELPSPRESSLAPAAFPWLADACSHLPLDWKVLEGLLIKIGLFYSCMGWHRVASQFAWSPVLKCHISTVQLAVFEGKEGREAGDPPLLSQAAFHCCSVLRPCYNLLTTSKMSQHRDLVIYG